LSFAFHFAFFFALAAIGPAVLRHIAPSDIIMVDLAEIPPKEIGEKTVQPEVRKIEATPVARSLPIPAKVATNPELSSSVTAEKVRPLSPAVTAERPLPVSPATTVVQPGVGAQGPSREQIRESSVVTGKSSPSVADRNGAQVQPPASAATLYVAALRSAIERCREYPLMARRQKLEGDVKIACQISREGELKGARIVSSSGISILDNAALRTVRSVGRFPPAPFELQGELFNFVAPIGFRLSAD
jgi:protein TonB